jgi:hypothetical protein
MWRPRKRRPDPTPAAPPPPSRVGAARRADNLYGLILGQKRQGKTTLLRQLHADRVRRGGRSTFVDTLGINGDGLGGVVVRSPRGWWDVARASVADGRPFNIILKPEPGADLGPFWAMAYELGGLLLAVDEIDRYQDSARIGTDLEKLAAWGGNRRVDMLATVRQLPELHRVLKANADILYAFRQGDRYYSKQLNERFFHLPDPATLERIPQFHYLRWELGGAVTWGRVSP